RVTLAAFPPPWLHSPSASPSAAARRPPKTPIRNTQRGTRNAAARVPLSRNLPHAEHVRDRHRLRVLDTGEARSVAADELQLASAGVDVELRFGTALDVHRLAQTDRKGQQAIDQIVRAVRRAHVDEQQIAALVDAHRGGAPAILRLLAPDVGAVARHHADALHHGAIAVLHPGEIAAGAVDD